MSDLSHADLGGQSIAARIVPEPEAGPFHASWEARVHALTLAIGSMGAWNLDMTRAARETLPDYRSLSYYEIWYQGLVTLLERHGLVSGEELAAGRSLAEPRPLARVLHKDRVAPLLQTGAPTLRETSRPARFALGERVRTRSGPFPGHTRLPRYARGRCGTIESLRGMHVFADAHAAGRGEQPEWLYTVVFPAAELWGVAACATRLSVSIDAWEPYLEPA
jgi:nitrile hydratase beta subunit